MLIRTGRSVEHVCVLYEKESWQRVDRCSACAVSGLQCTCLIRRNQSMRTRLRFARVWNTRLDPPARCGLTWWPVADRWLCQHVRSDQNEGTNFQNFVRWTYEHVAKKSDILKVYEKTATFQKSYAKPMKKLRKTIR